jgi:hypothetical protein
LRSWRISSFIARFNMLTKVLFLSFVVGAFARFVAVPVSDDSQSDLSQFNSENQAQGNGASAGNAGAGAGCLGNAQSINTANHQANGKSTHSDATSANAANGCNPTAGGAAQAQGGEQGEKSGQRQTSFNHQVQPVIVPVSHRNHGGVGFGNTPFNTGNTGFPSGNNQFPNGNFGNNNNFESVAPFGGSQRGQTGTSFQNTHQTGGTAAGAGSATALRGSATSLNNAQQNADENGDSESGISSNGASGFGPNTNGAASAGGETDKARQGSQFNTQQFSGFRPFGSRR